MSVALQRIAWIGLAGWALAALFFAYGWILRVAPGVMVEPLMREFKVGAAIVGNLSAMYFYTYVILQTPAGLAMDRWGPRRVLSITALIATAGCAISAWAPNVEFAYLGRLLIGGGVAFAFLGSLMLAAAWLPPQRFALYSGLGMGIGLMGGIFGQAPLAWLVDAQGWRTAMAWIGVGGGVMAVALWLIVRDRPPAAQARAAGGSLNSVLADLWRAVKKRQTNYLALFAGCASSNILVFGALWGVPFTMERFAGSRPAAAGAVSLMLLGFAIGAPVWGGISDRLHRRKAPLLCGALIAGAGVSAAIYLPLSFLAYQACLFLAGFGAGCMAVTYATAREHNPGAATGGALGYINMTSVVAGAVLQPVAGLLLDAQWDGRLVEGARRYTVAAYENAFLILPAVYVAGFLFALCVRETHCRPVIPTVSRRA